jgi:hypothetical protein
VSAVPETVTDPRLRERLSQGRPVSFQVIMIDHAGIATSSRQLSVIGLLNT